MKYIFSQEQVVVPDDVKVHIRSRIVTVEGPRGAQPYLQTAFPQHTKQRDSMDIAGQKRCDEKMLTRLWCRQAYQRSITRRSHILATREASQGWQAGSVGRNSPRCSKERRYPPNRQVDHRQSDHGCDKRLQIQDAIRLRTFPNQRQH